MVAVEVDEEVARVGASHLKAAGYEPELIVGDGLQGAPGGGPFDRVINTAALRRVPYAWIEQSRRKGVILTPFGTAYSNAGLLRLRVDSTGTKAQVQFVDEAGTSATIVRYGHWWEEDAVRSWGPRDVWAEVTAAYTWYELRGRPHITRFGITADKDGQYAWLDEPRRLVGS